MQNRVFTIICSFNNYQMRCTKCNAEIEDSAMFCPECGSKIERVVFCASCGAKLEGGATFCSNCGKKIEQLSEFSQEKMKCPYCGDEILATAKKCKHCGECLDDSHKDAEVLEENKESFSTNEDEDKKPSIGLRIFGRLLGTAVIFLIAFLLFKYGGWQMAWGKTKAETVSWTISELGQFNIPLTDAKNFIFNAHGILIRVNDNFYGAMCGTQYFDSPFIQWIMLFFALGAFVESFVFLFTGDFSSD